MHKQNMHKENKYPFSKRIFLFLCLFLGAAFIFTAPLKAQDKTSEQTEEQKAENDKQLQSRKETLNNLSDLLTRQKQQHALVKSLKLNLRNAKEDITKTELENELTVENKKLSDIEAQIAALSGGMSKEDFYAQDIKKFNLSEELESLAEPFIKMVKSSTENARQIDALKTTITEARKRKTISKKAIDRLDQLIQTSKTEKKDVKRSVTPLLNSQMKLWQKRLKEAQSLEETSLKQLQLKEKFSTTLNLDNYATNFIRTRGVNLLIAIATFFLTFTLIRLLGKTINIALIKSGFKKTFYARLAKLIIEILAIIISIITTMIVLNYLNDWVLLALSGFFVIALLWIGLKVLPALIEQIILLLNLGAVQEGERLLIDGIPWRVTVLDHYTEIENPALDGGQLTLPIRELKGMHSRPSSIHETWFPTQKGDWVQLENGHIAKVEQQSPELVQLIELGGARVTYTTIEFLNKSFRNLSTGFRIRQSFGISYKHQKQAADEIPELLTNHIQKGLLKLLTPETLKHVSVELKEAASSSIDYDIEVDIKGSEAHRFEDIEGEMTRLMITACNEYDLEIPYPHLVVTKDNQ